MSEFVLVPDSTSWRVNPDLFGDQRMAQHTVLSDGRILVVWGGTVSDDGLLYDYDVYGSLFTADGQPIGEPFQVNTYTYLDQVLPTVVALNDGGFVVTWQSFGQDSLLLDRYNSVPAEQYGIYQQVYDAGGARVGPEALVNTSVDGQQQRALTLATPDGGYVTLWEHFNFLSPNNPVNHAQFQAFDATGNPVGGETELPIDHAPFTLNFSSPRVQFQDATVLSDGSIAALIYGWALGGTWVTIFEPDGTHLSQFQLVDQSIAPSSTGTSTILSLDNGNILVAFTGGSFNDADIQVTIYAPDGSVVTPTFVANDADGQNQYIEDLLVLPDGNFLIVWHNSNENILVGRVFEPDGTPLSGEVQLTPGGREALDADVSVASDGRILLTFTHDLSDVRDHDNEVFAQFFDLNLQPAGTQLGAQNDTLVLGAENDSVDAAAGNDSILGNDGDDVLFGGAGADTLEGGAGHDVLVGGTGDDHLLGGAGDDRLTGGTGNDTLFGGDGNDELVGENGSSTIDGGLGHDLITAGHFVIGGANPLEQHLIYGDAGNDTISVTGYGRIFGGAGNDVIGTEAGVVRGGSGNDLIDGATFAYGDSGNDTIVGSLTSHLHGGGGQDVLVMEGGIVNAATGRLGQIQFQQEIYRGSVTGFEEYHFVSNYFVPYQIFYGSDSDEVVTWQSGYFTGQGGGGNDLFQAGDRGVPAPGNVLPASVEIDGGAGNDTIVGGYAEDVFEGGAGNDLIFGGRSRDWISGGAGNDTLTGGTGADRFVLGGASGTGGVDIITDFEIGEDQLDLSRLRTVSALSDAQIANAFASASHTNLGARVDFGNGTSVIFENLTAAQAAALYPDALTDPQTIYGTSGDDQLIFEDLFGDGAVMIGGGGNDLLWGAIGADTLIGGAGNDDLDGGGGDDDLLGGVGDDTLRGFRGNDTLSGGAGSDRIFGDDGDDSLSGGSGNDSLNGGRGNDTVAAGGGDNSLDGGEGEDTAVFAVSINQIEAATISYGTLYLTYNGTQSHFANFENFQFTDASYTLSEFRLALRFFDNTFTMGSSGADEITVTQEAAFVRALGGDDTVWSGSSVDYVEGGGGDDVLSSGGGNDTLLGNVGEDALYGRDGLDSLFGGDGNDTLSGGDDADWLSGGVGDDQLIGGEGADSLFGDAGNDTLWGSSAQDRPVDGLNSSALLTGVDLFGQTSDDTLQGAAGNDRIFGGAGQDNLDGSAGDDTLFAGAGSDTLTGGAGDDILQGNDGADTFVFRDGEGRDTITDFEATNGFERIDLSAVSSIIDLADLQADHMRQTGADVLIDTGGGNFITLTGVNIADLDSTNFVF